MSGALSLGACVISGLYVCARSAFRLFEVHLPVLKSGLERQVQLSSRGLSLNRGVHLDEPHTSHIVALAAFKNVQVLHSHCTGYDSNDSTAHAISKVGKRQRCMHLSKDGSWWCCNRGGGWRWDRGVRRRSAALQPGNRGIQSSNHRAQFAFVAVQVLPETRTTSHTQT